MKKICMFFALGIAAAPLFSQVVQLPPKAYIERSIAESTEIAALKEAAELAATNLEELKISEASELDLAEGELNLEVADAELSSAAAGLVADALATYVELYMAGRNLDHSETALAISAEREAAAKNQTEEGVKNQLDYYTEYLAYRNAQIAKTSAEYSYENAQRRFLRRLANGTTARVPAAGIAARTPPAYTSSYESTVEKARLVSPAYLKAAGNADIRSRRYAVFSELESSARTLRDLRIAEQGAIRTLNAQEYALEDRAWTMIQQLSVLRARAEVGEEQLEVAELRWEEKKRGYSFGVVTERQLKEHELSWEREIDAQIKREFDLLVHYLRLVAFIGGDPLAEAGRLLR